MSNSDRRRYLTATTLDQDLLDDMQDNLDARIEMTLDIDRPPEVLSGVSIPAASPAVVTFANHELREGDVIRFTTTGTLPSLTTLSDYYVRNPDTDTFNISLSPTGALVDAVDPQSGTHSVEYNFTIRVSDRNKFTVDTNGRGLFYEALTNFPVITRTVGEFLNPTLEFSTISIRLSNVDGRFNDIIPGGDSFAGWVGRDVEVKVGLAEVEDSYFTIFKGDITDVGGFGRNTDNIVLKARDQNDRFNKTFPETVFLLANYPKISNSLVGKPKPIVLGDFDTELDPLPAIVPGITVNEKDPFIDITSTQPVESVDTGTEFFTVPDHRFDNDDTVEFQSSGSVPAPLVAGTLYYIISAGTNTFQVSTSIGGGAIDIASTGSGEITVGPHSSSSYATVDMVVSDNVNRALPNEIVLQRGEDFYNVPSTEVTIGGSFNAFSVSQNTATLWVDGAAYLWQSGDVFLCKPKGLAITWDATDYSTNIIAQARQLLLDFAGMAVGDFDANWATYRDKASPAVSNIAGIKSRAYIDNEQNVVTYALSMLEQVRLEAYFARSDNKLKILSMHLEDFDAAPTHRIRNWDTVEKSFKPKIDDRTSTTFNRVAGVFNAFPAKGNELAYQTPVFRNIDAVLQHGKAISKKVLFPNLYVAEDCENQVKEILRIASSTIEHINVDLTWRTILKDVSDFVLLDVKIGSSIFDEVPCMIRSIGYDPSGIKLPVKLFSFQMLPFGSGAWDPAGEGYGGVVGGDTATITQET